MAVKQKPQLDLNEAVKIARWFIAADAKLKARAMRLGGVQEVVSEVILRLMKIKTLDRNIALSTVVCRQVRWTIGNMSQAQVRWDRALDSATKVASKDVFVSDFSHGVWVDQCKDAIQIAMKQTLTDRSIDVLCSRMHGQTLEEIGERLGISRERVRCIAEIAVSKVATRLERLKKDVIDEDAVSKKRKRHFMYWLN